MPFDDEVEMIKQMSPAQLTSYSAACARIAKRMLSGLATAKKQKLASQQRACIARHTATKHADHVEGLVTK